MVPSRQAFHIFSIFYRLMHVPPIIHRKYDREYKCLLIHSHQEAWRQSFYPCANDIDAIYGQTRQTARHRTEPFRILSGIRNHLTQRTYPSWSALCPCRSQRKRQHLQLRQHQCRFSRKASCQDRKAARRRRSKQSRAG